MLQRQKEEEAILLKKKQEEEAEFYRKKQEEAAAIFLKKQQLFEKREDLELMKQVLVTKVGFPPSEAVKLAETLVMEHKVGSEKLFQLKVGRDKTGYIAKLQLDVDGVLLLEEYFRNILV